MTRDYSPRRSAFTLVEMMVASALIIFMMWIIASAFQKGLESFSVLKTAGDMQEKLRGATTVIRRDLVQPHFSTENGPESENLSGQRLDLAGWQPPLEGYFRIYQSGARTAEGVDPDDPSSMHYRVADTAQQGDVLQFTVKQRGARRDQFAMIDLMDPGNDIQGFVTMTPTPKPWGRMHRFSFPIHMRRLSGQFTIPPSAGGGTYTPTFSDTMPEPEPTVFATTWTDVTYFLRPNGDSTGTMPLFNLYRRQNLLAVDLLSQSQPVPGGVGAGNEKFNYSTGPSPRPLDLNGLANTGAAANYLEISSWANPNDGSKRVNDQRMVNAPIRRFGVVPGDVAGRFRAPIPTMFEEVGNLDSPQTGTDLLLTNLTDFEVKVLWDPVGTGPGSIRGPQPTDDLLPGVNNPDFPFDRLPPVTNPNTPWQNQRIFDTWSRRVIGSPPEADDYGSRIPPAWNAGYGAGAFGSKSIPLKVRVRAVMIEMRIWDTKTQQSRQITIIQDL